MNTGLKPWRDTQAKAPQRHRLSARRTIGAPDNIGTPPA